LGGREELEINGGKVLVRVDGGGQRGGSNGEKGSREGLGKNTQPDSQMISGGKIAKGKTEA